MEEKVTSLPSVKDVNHGFLVISAISSSVYVACCIRPLYSVHSHVYRERERGGDRINLTSFPTEGRYGIGQATKNAEVKDYEGAQTSL